MSLIGVNTGEERGWRVLTAAPGGASKLLSPGATCRPCNCASAATVLGLLVCLLPTLAHGQTTLQGRVLDPQGAPVPAAYVSLVNAAGAVVVANHSDAQGECTFRGINTGSYQIVAESDAFVTVWTNLAVASGQQQFFTVRFRQITSTVQAITVVASAPSSLSPDPSQSIVVHDDVLDANPGRPGAPLSIPGLPIETAAGGIKAPQYFAPGVAGDHGEPIAQYFQIGNFLYPNNLPANAHGNGYADPNFLIPLTIESVDVDGGAFNVREGNNSIDVGAAYSPRSRFNTFLQLTGDYRDADIMAGWSPSNRDTNAWIAGEFSFGNGFLDRLEHRQQYKLNGFREYHFGHHDLKLFGVGYYGFSYLPGLTPINIPVPGDTIDDRQRDITHTFVAIVSDNWKLSQRRQFSFSGFYRNYALQLRSNFGDGLIQQSETRNVVGGEAMYVQSVRPWLAFMGGVDLRRDAPRNLDLKKIDNDDVFQPVTSNNLTMSFVEPFASVDGSANRYLHFNLGVRQEEVWMNNQDLLNPQNSFDKLATLTLPKATLTLLPPDRWYLPIVSFSYGEAFHTNDPRIGTGSGQPTLLAPSRAYQLIVSKVIKRTQFYLTLRRVSNSLELAKIDADTGLQEVVGPSLNKVLAVSMQRNFSFGSLYLSYAQADARDRTNGEPIPEAPRMIIDAIGSFNRLPYGFRLRGEYEYVKAKQLGDGFTGIPVTEIRGALLRTFLEERTSIAANFLIASGYTGQTTETLALPGEPAPSERMVGVPLKSYVGLSWTFYFKR
jgi:Carboxypeptidase regulatory-like domain